MDTKPPLHTPDQCREIWELRATGMIWSKIGERYGCSQSAAISAAKRFNANLPTIRTGQNRNVIGTMLTNTGPGSPGLSQALTVDEAGWLCLRAGNGGYTHLLIEVLRLLIKYEALKSPKPAPLPVDTTVALE